MQPMGSFQPPPPSMDENESHELERLREELELVAYVTSHDLQSPLRAILSVCEELERHPGLKDGEGKAALDILNQQSQRMKTLMQGLLEYIRLETFTTASNSLDANELADTAIATLENEIRAAGGHVTHDLLPQVNGHRGRLTRLFAFLIENAIKFHGPTPPQVHISAKRVGDSWEFCVADNGIGMDEEHQEIIFRLYQRLHGEEYPGHGIGLALARKIAEAHGGKLWVESQVQEGSRFYFTLPADNVKNGRT